MTNRIKVVANTPDAVGMRHPVDGALAAEGSLWAYDTFTLQRIHAGSIRHAEAGDETAEVVDATVAEVVPASEAKPTRASRAAAAADKAATA